VALRKALLSSEMQKLNKNRFKTIIIIIIIMMKVRSFNLPPRQQAKKC